MRLILILTLFFAVPVVGFAQTTWYVPDDFPGGIQAAISDANVVNGDTVIVRSGTYIENIDFLGKAIVVKSEQGPDVTVVDGNQVSSVVKFQSGEDSNSVLEGFTIINGSGILISEFERGGGIYCYFSSPTIENNVITNNIVDSYGGGIYCDNSSPIIKNNVVSANWSDYQGGGIYLILSSPTVTNNVISKNFAKSAGGGIYCGWSSPTMINNTLCNNSALARAGGIGCSLFSSPIVMNTILWNNDAPSGPEIWMSSPSYPSTVTISFSDVKGGQGSVVVEPGCTLNWGPGMIDSDPLFVDSAAEDFHLTFPSPCKDTGDKSAVLDPEDFEGDPRTAYDTVDMGADEFYHHLYYTGDVTPGGFVAVKITGLPGSSPVTLWAGSGVLDPPWPTQYGIWYLQLPIVTLRVWDQVPCDGLIVLLTHIPPDFPPWDIPLQTLVEDQLTNLSVMKVK